MAGTRLGGDAAFGGSAVPRVAGGGSDVTADINVTPMIDVMLVLLIIFMVVTPALAFEAKLPKAKTAAPEKEERVTLGIDKQGKFFVDDKPVADAELETRLREAYAKRPDDHVLYLKADDELEVLAHAHRHHGGQQRGCAADRRDHGDAQGRSHCQVRRIYHGNGCRRFQGRRHERDQHDAHDRRAAGAAHHLHGGAAGPSARRVGADPAPAGPEPGGAAAA
jgi:biopolymer transport protein ExbD